MKKLILMAVLSLLSFQASAGEINAKKFNDTMFWVGTAALVTDFVQTKSIVNDPNYYETNKFLGKYPTQKEVENYFLGLMVLHVTFNQLLPEKYRTVWNIKVAFDHGTAVHNNFRIGVSTRF